MVSWPVPSVVVGWVAVLVPLGFGVARVDVLDGIHSIVVGFGHRCCI